MIPKVKSFAALSGSMRPQRMRREHACSEVTPLVHKTGIYVDNSVSTMAADTVAPCIYRSSVVMVLNMQDNDYAG